MTPALATSFLLTLGAVLYFRRPPPGPPGVVGGVINGPRLIQILKEQRV
jgi:hypothetical protein